MKPDSNSESLTIRLFGPLDVRCGGHPLPRLRSRKGEWLLALLILRDDRIDFGRDRFHSLVPFQVSHAAQRKNYHGSDDSKSNV